MSDNKFEESLINKARAEFAKVSYARLLGLEIISLSESAAVLKLALRDELLQLQGVLHGGATASLIDTTMAFAIIARLGADEKTTTVDLTVHYLRPVSSGEVVCTAKVVRAGRRLVTVSAECVDANGKMTATALSTYAKIE